MTALLARARRGLRWAHANALLGMIGLITSLLLFGAGVVVGVKSFGEQVDCFDDYASDRVDAETPIREANVRLRAAQRAYVEATVRLFELTEQTPRKEALLVYEDVREAYSGYLDADDELSDEQEQNPYPEPPREVC